MSFEQEKKEQEAIEAMNNPVLTQGESTDQEKSAGQETSEAAPETELSDEAPEETADGAVEEQKENDEADSANQTDGAGTTDRSL